MPLGEVSGMPEQFRKPVEENKESVGKRATEQPTAPAMPPFMIDSSTMFRQPQPLPEPVPMAPVEYAFDAHSSREDILRVAQDLLGSIVDGATSGETQGAEFHQRCQALQLTMEFLAIKV